MTILKKVEKKFYSVLFGLCRSLWEVLLEVCMQLNGSVEVKWFMLGMETALFKGICLCQFCFGAEAVEIKTPEYTEQGNLAHTHTPAHTVPNKNSLDFGFNPTTSIHSLKEWRYFNGGLTQGHFYSLFHASVRFSNSM